MERICVGVVGTSQFAERFHLPGLKSHPQAEVVAICGRNRERAADVAATFGIPRVFTDWRELIERGELDALVVVTPDDLHCPITMAALEAGLHVSCEKPLALTAADAEAMYRKAEAAGVKHMTFFSCRFIPPYQYVKRLLDDGYIGRPLQCSIRQAAGYAFHSPKYSWRFDRQRANGILGDFGSHALDVARWFVGEISSVSCRLATFVEHLGPDGQPMDAANDSAMLAVQFVNGAQGTVQVSGVVHTGDLLGGADPSASIMVQTVHHLANRPMGERLFIDSILADRPIVPGFYEGWKALQAIEAALEADRRGCWVAVG